MKLHIGCGEKHLPGYVHVDIIEREHIDYVSNAKDLSFLEEGSVSEIYACHVLEHFKRHEISGVLKEWARVLQVEGVLRLAVPSFEAVVAEYLSSKNLDLLIGLLYGGQNYDYNYHYQTYDFKRMRLLLETAGFTRIATYDWRDFLPVGYDDYSKAYIPHMDFDNGRLMSLNIITVKG